MDFLHISLIVISLFTSVALIAAVIILRSREKEIDRLRIQVGQRDQAQDLTEFLSDVKTHGFGFVRVNPTNIMYRR